MTIKQCRYMLLIFAALALPLLSHAQDGADGEKPAEEPAKETAEKPVEEAKARPPDEDSLRDPFWPVDHVPTDPNELAKIDETRFAPEDWPKLTLVGVSSTSSGWIAFLKDIGPVSVGEKLTLKKGARVYSLLVTSIDKTGIKTKRLGSKLIPSSKTTGTTSTKKPPRKAPGKAPASRPAPSRRPAPGRPGGGFVLGR